jgi:hypothetical protein
MLIVLRRERERESGKDNMGRKKESLGSSPFTNVDGFRTIAPRVIYNQRFLQEPIQ